MTGHLYALLYGGFNILNLIKVANELVTQLVHVLWFISIGYLLGFARCTIYNSGLESSAYWDGFEEARKQARKQEKNV